MPASAKNGCFQKQTEFDAINDTFDTRDAHERRARTWSDSAMRFAGRGASLNEAISKLRPLSPT